MPNVIFNRQPYRQVNTFVSRRCVTKCIISAWLLIYVHFFIKVLQPTSSLRRLRLWSDYYLRYDETFWSPNFSLFDFKQQNENDEVGYEKINMTFL